jgi:sigma-B regulation protein RsbU (phosphoserine phosphatase)
MQRNHSSPLPAQRLPRTCHFPDYRAALESARRVQQNLFPRRLPRAPGWDIAGHCQPAESVGGDYYDLFEVAPGRLGVALGDVSGKGLGPAVVMAQLHGLARGLMPADPASLGPFAADLNERLAQSLPDSWFVTLFLAVVDLASGRLDYVNAGHPPALLQDPDCPTPAYLTTGGTALGAFPGECYEVGQAMLRPGSLLAVFSDGLTEARNPDGEMFRAPRAAEVLHGARARPAGEVLAALRAAAERFTGSANQEDDLTLVVVRREADGPAPRGR